ncbi:MAG TPA: RimK/LysX family protein [Cytophagaceae bacterium]
MKAEKIVIGRTDKIDIPEFNIKNISAKIDTGAFTSVLHCSQTKVSGGKLTFHIVDKSSKGLQKRVFVVDDFTQRVIKNSFGDVEKRYVIKVKIVIFNKTIDTEFSLTDRSNMKHPVLLGRKFLNGKFIVDVSKFNLSYREKNKNKKRKL